MASIVRIGEKWRALIRRKGFQNKCKTFPNKAQAEQWARGIEAAMDQGSAPTEPGKLTVADLIRTYRQMREESRPISDTSTERYTLETIEALLGDKLAGALVPADLVSFAKDRSKSAGPYTINMDVSKLGTVMKYAGAALGVRLPDVVKDSRPLLTHLGLIGGGGKRDRRPTQDELEVITEHLRSGRGSIYADAVEFAAACAMRRGEVTRIMWADLDREKRLILVRDRKDPRQKVGNDQWVPLLPQSWSIIERLEQTDERIFPIHPQTLSKYFTETCRALSIPDLHLHDMRHEGTSRMFEQGYAIQHVAMVTGHKSWNMLRRYTNLKPEDVHNIKPLEPASSQDSRQHPDKKPSARRPQRKS